MTDRTPVPGTRALVVFCASLALLAAGCGEKGDTGKSASKGGGNPVSTPTASRPVPSGGKGSKDPDDINGDGHRDLLLPLAPRSENGDGATGVVFGSAKGLDPSTHAVYDYAPGTVTTADLDGDGYPDFVTTEGSMEQESPTVDWGSPGGPKAGAEATRIQVPGEGLSGPVRGDFDGDGHHDIAALRQDGSVVLLYGPFARSGAPARTDTRPGGGSWLAADDIVPSGKPRATGLLVHEGDDGEQTDGILYHPARDGSGLSRTSVELREGNAVAFGDYDGDGARDLAIGDNGSRNDEPDTEEDPETVSSLAVYPGKGGAPVTYKIPESRNSDYGPGGYTSADPDGDGKDALVVSTNEGALLIEGEKRTKVLREGPARAKGKKTPAPWRHARPYAATDFDADGKEELILNWGAGTIFGLYGENPTHWWLADGTSSRDKTAFATTSFAGRG
ncbi:VCBS repeat-containing protein [Streptomyces durmitorensis]|uniref:VCBS repeat-containing protein n=1 Tax=Streptomyces durmitorensis TaxID=319947 RepID=A0ABY4PRI4_9ACTN|nr:VCBS repeat-containing protein [Streptomyces durmitorensis]UQT55690.1 VCBS repeat-containing protein [Streptomyces durmitorensis]